VVYVTFVSRAETSGFKENSIDFAHYSFPTGLLDFYCSLSYVSCLKLVVGLQRQHLIHLPLVMSFE